MPAYPYRIRLATQWEVLPARPLSLPGPVPHRVGPWSEQGWAVFLAPVTLSRNFGRPRLPHRSERIHLVVGGCDGYSTFLVNDVKLYQDVPPWTVARLDITELVGPRNRVSVELTPPRTEVVNKRPHGGILWGAEIQICSSVWIEHASAVATRTEGGAVEIRGLVEIGSSERHPVRVQILVSDGHSPLARADATTEPAPCLYPYCISFLPERAIVPAHTQELPWLVGLRRCSPGEILRTTFRVWIDPLPPFELTLPCGLIESDSDRVAPEALDFAEIASAPEAYLESADPGSVALVLSDEAANEDTIAAVVSRLSGHPAIARWLVATSFAETSRKAVEFLRQWDPVRPVLEAPR